jgi:hypothetical protein
MARIWRIVFFLAAAAILVPATAALLVAVLGELAGCGMQAEACGYGFGEALGFTLWWAWHRVLDPAVLALLTAAAAVGAALGFATRRLALLWGAMGACWGPIAALLLPYVAVSMTMPGSCRLSATAASQCIVWGETMGRAFSAAGAAFWGSVFVVPIALGGVAMTWLVARLSGHPGDLPLRPGEG